MYNSFVQLNGYKQICTQTCNPFIKLKVYKWISKWTYNQFIKLNNTNGFANRYKIYL